VGCDSEINISDICVVKENKMTKLDYESGTQVPVIELKCEKIKERLMSVVWIAEPVLQQVRNLVRGQKAAIVAELGADNATALLAVYTKLKEAVEAGKGVTIEDIPEN